MSTTATIIQEGERRAARDSYQRAGGSKRRPLQSFMTTAEKKERRVAHAELLKLAIAELDDLEGFAAWLETLDLNPQLTACNAALVALQTPGEVVGTSASWKKQGCHPAKGDHAAGRLTAPGFWPLAYFTADQVGALDLADLVAPARPAGGVLSRLQQDLRDRLASEEKPRLALDAVAEAYRSGRVALWETA